MDLYPDSGSCLSPSALCTPCHTVSHAEGVNRVTISRPLGVRLFCLWGRGGGDGGQGGVVLHEYKTKIMKLN